MKASVKQDENNPVPTEIIAQAIVDISKGIKKLRAGPLNEKALILLIQNAAPTKDTYGKRYGVSEIKDILKGVENLAETFIKKKEKTKARRSN